MTQVQRVHRAVICVFLLSQIVVSFPTYAGGICCKIGTVISEDIPMTTVSEDEEEKPIYFLTSAGLVYSEDFFESADENSPPSLIIHNEKNASVQYNLGTQYLKGRGVPKSYTDAEKWFRLAADQGHAMAQNSLGKMYEVGLGVAQDYIEAAKWYSLAVEQDLPEAKRNLAYLFREGLGVPRDLKKALELYRSASSQ